MSFLSDYITNKNETKKVLSIFLTAGYPKIDNFQSLVLDTFDSGADIIELGIPFSDPLADGKTIQASSQVAIENGVTLDWIFETVAEINKVNDKPIVLMGYANPILKYGIEKFIRNAENVGVAGLIIPDIPMEEYGDFWGNINTDLDIILLTTPTSNNIRISKIDNLSSGFLYCVSVTGTTGAISGFDDEIIKNVESTYNLVANNKMLVGFGISEAKDIEQLKPICDGMIVGSAIIKSLSNDDNKFSKTMSLIRELNKSTYL